MDNALLDGGSRGLVRPALENLPRVVRVVVFETEGLGPGTHRIRLVNRGPD